jgi:hypothetical protein
MANTGTHSAETENGAHKRKERSQDKFHLAENTVLFHCKEKYLKLIKTDCCLF